MLTNHADIALGSRTKLTKMFFAFLIKQLIKVFNQILHTKSCCRIDCFIFEIFYKAKAKSGPISVH